MTTNKLVKNQFKNKKLFVALVMLAIASLIGLIVGLIIYSIPTSEVSLNDAAVIYADGIEVVDSKLAVIIFLAIFGSLVAITIVTISVWLLILKFKSKSKVKIPLASQELNSPTEVIDMEEADA